MAAGVPILRIEIEGKGRITPLFLKENLPIINKREFDQTILESSGPSGFVTLMDENSGFDRVHKILVNAPEKNVANPFTTTLRITRTDDSIVTFGVQGANLYSFNDDEAALIKKVEIGTDSVDISQAVVAEIFEL